MNIRLIHFIREIVAVDARGRATPTMQFSYDNASFLHPSFVSVSRGEAEQLRRLYLDLGGTSPQAGRNGTTVIIPNRPWIESFRGITAEGVRIVATTDS